MHILRLFLIAFGVVFLLSLTALGRQIAAEHLAPNKRSETFRGSPEGWLLLAVVLVLASRYLGELAGPHSMPGIETGWLVGYGACCAVYLAIKAVRVFRIPD